jgi:hypothetical protein
MGNEKIDEKFGEHVRPDRSRNKGCRYQADHHGGPTLNGSIAQGAQNTAFSL